MRRRAAGPDASRPDGLAWRGLPRAAQLFVGAVIVVGASALVAFFPLTYPRPLLFAVLLVSACLTSVWKVNLPISLASGSTLSMSHAADLMSLLLLGPRHALLVAVAGAWTQCTFNVKRRYPLYRTVFSAATEGLTILVTGLAYSWLGGPEAPSDFSGLPKPLVGAIATYFLVNTGLVAGAIALSADQPFGKVWRDDFLWSGVSFMVASSAGALAAVVVQRGDHWTAVLMLAPVYLTYRTYVLFVGRLDAERRRLESERQHVAETRRLHQEAVQALLQARQAERALTNEKERLAVTLRSIGDGVITTDLDGTILSMNNVAETLTGWIGEQAIGQPLANVFQSFDPETRERCDNSVARVLRDTSTLGIGRRCTILAAKDLSEHPIEESPAPIRNAEGRTIGIVLAFRDITDALRIQEERAKASKLASLELLAGGMANDFNNTLMAVMGNLSMARATMPRTGLSADWLMQAEQACARARRLTWQLLTFSKGGVPGRKTVAVAHILQESVDLVLRGSTVDRTFDIPPDLWSVDADPAQMVQVFSNVLINARQAVMYKGVLTIRAENVCEVERRWENALPVAPGRYVRVSIIDNGIGIPKEHLSRIFDPYFSTKTGASGFGLATTYAIMKSHGGFLAVDSQVGRGTTVQINFPAVIRDVAEHADSVTRADGGKHRVLIMDDEASIRTLAANMLKFLGYDAEVAESGSAAVERFKRALADGRPFDVVLLDLMVPGDGGGTEAMDRLGDLAPDVKAILMSGALQDSVVTRFHAHGFSAVITKPFTLKELSATLHSVMASPSSRVH